MRLNAGSIIMNVVYVRHKVLVNRQGSKMNALKSVMYAIPIKQLYTVCICKAYISTNCVIYCALPFIFKLEFLGDRL